VEARVGGNPSSNVGVDYGRQLRRSAGRAEVRALYEQAGLSLEDDLATLAAAPRIARDPAAVAALDAAASFAGSLAVPVLTVHDVADPLVPVEHEQAYAALVKEAGNASQLRQVFLDRAGHCTMSPAETVAALQVMGERVATGRFGRHATDAGSLNARALALGPELNAHLDDDTGQPVPTPPAFTRFQPGRFLRP
jgi:pimeloyl-ACP methyl ester carboxylesterase